MSNIIEIISSRLNDKELLSCEINRLIRDVFNIISQDRNYESSRLKQALKILGWKEDVLDYRTLELICFYLEGSREVNNHPRSDCVAITKSRHSGRAKRSVAKSGIQ